MKLFAFAIASLLALPLGAAATAQSPDDRGRAAQDVYNWCMRLPTGTPAECGCVAGFYAGYTAEDEFQIVATMLGHIGTDLKVADPAAMQAALQDEKAYLQISDTRFDEIMAGFAQFGEIGDMADAICVPVENAANAAAAVEAAAPQFTPNQ